jgi:HD-GYP domain-containing protein (c-di-GMP phosphodiesterase class II)
VSRSHMLTITNPMTSASTPLSRIGGVSEALSLPESFPAKPALRWSPAAIHVKEIEEQLSALRTSLICAFNQLLDLKDLNTGVHSTRLAEWALHVAGELGLDESALSDIEVAALLHDVGKIGIPDSILQKPAKLTDEEYNLMKKHPEYGWAVLRHVPGMERASLMILHHHESYDGRGYPAGLKGQEIPIGSRIVSVIDAFDAMVSSRPYREGLPFEEAERRLLQARGTQFDPQVVDRFLPLARAEMSSVFAAAGTSVSAAL